MYLLELHEMPIVAHKLKESLTRDLVDFEALPNEFNHRLISELDRLARALQPEQERPKDLQIPELLSLLDALTPQLQLLERELNSDILEKLLKSTAKTDRTAINKQLKRLLLLFEKHQELISESFLDTSLLASLQGFVNHTEHTSNGTRGVLSPSDTHEALWQLMKKICIAGQSLYKHGDPARAKDYSFKWLKQRWCHPNAEVA